MGFFSRLKKSKDESTQQPQPRYTSQEYPSFDLEYSSGDVATVEFQGIIEVDGKQLHKVAIIYKAPNNEMSQERVLLEPLYGEYNGQRYDATASHYARLGKKPDEYSTPEEKRRYNEVKGFFQKKQVQYIKEYESKSDYIGYLSHNAQGRAFRAYDNDFRGRYAQIYAAQETELQAIIDKKRAQNAAIQARDAAKREELIKEGKMQQELHKGIYDDKDTRGYAGILTAEDYEEQYGPKKEEGPSI